MKDFVSQKIKKIHPKNVSSFVKSLIESARPIKPRNELFSQGQSMEDFILAEDTFEWPFQGAEGLFTAFVLKDGSFGAGLWLQPISHEMFSEKELTEKLENFAELISKIKSPNVSLQIIFDSEPETETTNHWTQKENFAQKIASKRFEFLSEFAREKKFGLRLVKRRILLTLRLCGCENISTLTLIKDSEIVQSEKLFLVRISELRDTLSQLQNGLVSLQLNPRNLNREEYLIFFRDSLHSIEMRKQSSSRHQMKSKTNSSLADQILFHAVNMTPESIGTGSAKAADTWQVASLLELPESTVFGIMAKLLNISQPHRIILNIKPFVKSNDLDTKRYLLKNASDAFGTRQMEDITAAQYRMNREEVLVGFSMHLLLRNEGVEISEISEKGMQRSVISDISSMLGANFIEETLCAPLVFAACLPFQNSPEICALVGRETRTLSRNLAGLLPLFGGFKGTKSPLVQMISRGGERIHLNPRDSNGASHLAVLGGSGAGKSFSIANMTVGFIATYPQGRVFIIDKKTSYAALAWLSEGEKSFGGATYFNPPQNFPNIFSGVCARRKNSLEISVDEDRLPSIVNLLLTAISLLSPKADLSATHTRVLSDAIRLTCEEKARHASTKFDLETGRTFSEISENISLPKLSEVLNNLVSACDSLQFSQALSSQLKEYLSPFVGLGPYSKFFDVEGVEDAENKVPLLTLCDLDGVSSDPVLLVLTVQAVVLEILRLVKPKNDGSQNPPSLLIIEEVGVLASESPALVAFIRDAWKTMRKFGVTCIGVTNEVSDFTEKPGPKEIWNVSPNKLILTQNSSAISEMEALISEGKNGLVPSLYHCEILRNLKMQKGAFAEAFWMGESAQGTYVYFPTGFDYWCAASDPIELKTLKELSQEIWKQNPESENSTFQAVSVLAEKYPLGVREKGELRSLCEAEKLALLQSLESLVREKCL